MRSHQADRYCLATATGDQKRYLSHTAAEVPTSAGTASTGRDSPARQAPALSPQVANPTVVKKYSFKKIDFSGDKQISREEAKKAGISDAEFNLIDKDNSGFITWNEAVNSPSKNWTE